MLSSIIQKIKSVPSYLYRNYAAPRIYSIRDRKILSRNLELKNKYAGRRCFLIGAGPSVANIDFSKLSREYTFVVNDFEKNKQHRSLASKFHLISESNYFTEGGPERRLGLFKEKDKYISTDTTMIINLAAIPLLPKNGLFTQQKK